MRDITALVPQEDRAGLKKRRQPAWISPMLATLTNDRFSNPDWLYERKFDGERCLAFRNGRQLDLLTRNQKTLNGTYPELYEALRGQQADDFIVDGEVVAFAGGATSFARLQQRMQRKAPERVRRQVAVYYYLFDILYAGGYDVTALPLRIRKEILRQTIDFRDPLRFSTHRNAQGEAYYRSACKRAWEGVIAKRADSRYESRRSSSWLKFKCVQGQELAIGGYTGPQGSRIGLGALLVGYFEGGKLRYAGKVGTGYDEATLRMLHKRLSAIVQTESPFSSSDLRGLPKKRAHWVAPKLVAQVGFTEWTRDGKLRHPRFLGLRTDKDTREVVRERDRHEK
ncbi:MAG: non-homologous end-joining DNA ligase [Bryobacteraceae bacterium]